MVEIRRNRGGNKKTGPGWDPFCELCLRSMRTKSSRRQLSRLAGAALEDLDRFVELVVDRVLLRL